MGPQRKIRNRRPRQLQCSTKYPLSKEPQNLKNAEHHPSVKQTPNLGKAELKVVSLIQSDMNGSDDDQSNGLAILFCNNGVPISLSSSTLLSSTSLSYTLSSSKRCYLVPLARLIAVGLMLMDTGVIVKDAITCRRVLNLSGILGHKKGMPYRLVG